MYYPRFTKVIIDYFMTRKPSISRRNRINWHYVRDDVLFSTIKVVSRHQTTQQYGAILPIELTTDDIRNSKAYKEYYACATGEATPKPKASARKKKVVSAPRLSGTAKGKQPVRATTHTETADTTEAEQLKIVLKRRRQETHISQQRGLGTDEGTDSHVTLTPVNPDGPQESSSVSSFVTSMLNPISDAGVESIFTTVSSPIVSLQIPTPIMTPSTIATITTSSDAPIPSTIIPSVILENIPTFNSTFRFDEILRSLETTFSEYRQTNPFVDVVSAIPESLNATLEAEVLTRSSHSSRTSYAITADLLEMELKKILIEKMEGNKSIQRSDEQRNLYKALVEAYDADKAILDTYGESTILKR
nr:hypothetical protein [Tanacetum cinerariifolium]